MIPSSRTIALLGLWSLLGLIPAFAPTWLGLWWAIGATIAVILLVDATRALRSPTPQITRKAPPVVSMQAMASVQLEIENPGDRPLSLTIFDHLPKILETEVFPKTLEVPPRHRIEWSYPIHPKARGNAVFGPIELRVRSPFGGFERRHRLPVETALRIYPNFDAVRRYELMAITHRTSQLGIRRRPRRGDGLDFHQLREYRAGDALRQVDWKATSRFQRPISREYQDERDQQIILVLDCGRRMRTQDGPLSHQDAALDAALLVANVALRQGDAVGFATLGGIDRWMAPRKGRTHLAALLEGLFDVHAQPRATDHLAAATEIMRRVPKRSLVVWVSNLRDEDGTELEAAMRLLSRRHLVLLANLRESALDRALEAPIHSREDAIRVAGIHHYLADRRQAHHSFASAEALLLDCAPAELPIALVNGYLEVKAAGLL